MASHSRGFTLIEALVSLVLLGLMAGFVFPKMSRWYEAIADRQSLAELRTQLKQLSAVAVLTGRDLTLEQAVGETSVLPAGYRIDLPVGWRVLDAGRLRFLRSGLCQEGSARISAAPPTVVLVSGNAVCELDVTLTAGAGGMP